MSLINCPECGHEVSSVAETCPNCGRPMPVAAPIVNDRVIVARPRRKEGLPTWIYAPLGILAVVIIFLVIMLLRNNEDETAGNVNVRVSNQQKKPESREVTRAENPPNQVNVPSSTTQVNPPQTSAPSYPPTTSAPAYPSTSTDVPSTQTQVKPVTNGKGNVVIDAKISTKTGTVQSVKNEKFYLLDKDLEEILSEAKLEPIEGNTLSDSFGLAVLYPDQYADFKRDALNAINKHIKYNTTTDSGGKGSMRDVKPDNYYLFGITRTKNGFAIWSSPVSIIEGENKLNLQPAMLNEMSDRSGE